MRRAIAAVLVVLLVAPEVFAGDLADWKNVTRLRRGTKVLVYLKNGDQVVGKLDSASDAGVRVVAPEKSYGNWSEDVKREDVQRVEQQKGHGELPDNPGRVMLLSTVGGGAAGAIVGGIQDATGRNKARAVGYGLGGAAFGFLGSAVVLGIIAVVQLGRGPRRTEVVYQAHR